MVWIGLAAPKFDNKPRAVIITILSLVFLLALWVYLLIAFEDTSMLANARFAGLGFGGIVPILMYAIIQTGLSEEIFLGDF